MTEIAILLAGVFLGAVIGSIGAMFLLSGKIDTMRAINNHLKQRIKNLEAMVDLKAGGQ